VGYGTVVAAGSILRHDVTEDGRLVVAGSPPGFERDHLPQTYRNLTVVVRNNLVYLANLVALEEWYKRVREPFFARQELGEHVYKGALEMLSLAKTERMRCLIAMAEKVPASGASARELRERAAEVGAIFDSDAFVPEGGAFLAALGAATSGGAGGYLETIQRLTPDLSAAGVEWLQQIVGVLCGKADMLLPSMDSFGGGH
jgi:UDP-N-acetylglucosamine/UDP-N-acetylgalactosamine diphosphorylase